MTYGQNTESNISSFVNTIFEDALLIARDNNVMAGLVHTFNDRTGLAARSNSQYGGATINTIAETDDLTSQVFTPSVIATLTPAEAGGQYFMTDSRLESDPFSARNDASMDLGMATGTKIETDLLGDFTSFTGGTVGAAGTALTWGYFYAMETRLKAQKAPYPYFFVAHPYQLHPMLKSASVGSSSATNAADSLLEDINQMFFIQRVGGVYIFASSNVAIDGSADAVCGMFSRDALGFDVRRAPRLEPERDASRRGWELNMSTVYAHGVWRPLFGIQGTFAADAPTS